MDLTAPPTLDQSQPGQDAPPAAQPDRRKKAPLDPLGASVVLLHGILKMLNRMWRGQEPFQLSIICNSQAGETGFGSPSRQGGTGASGIVRFVHNPTAGALTLTLLDGDNRLGTPMFSASLAAGASQLVWLPFTSDIMASSGSNCQIAGTYRP